MADNPNTDESIRGTGGIPVLQMTVSPSNNVQTPVDKTLSISEMAADAKATGDAINNLGSLLEEEITDLAADVIPKAWIDNTLTEEGQVAESKTVGDALAEIRATIATMVNVTYPVGSIYTTTEASVPVAFGGTWQEILITTTWNDLRNGTKHYAPVPGTAPERTVHYFLRIG